MSEWPREEFINIDMSYTKYFYRLVLYKTYKYLFSSSFQIELMLGKQANLAIFGNK